MSDEFTIEGRTLDELLPELERTIRPDDPLGLTVSPRVALAMMARIRALEATASGRADVMAELAQCNRRCFELVDELPSAALDPEDEPVR